VSDAEAERQRGDLLRAVRYVVGFRPGLVVAVVGLNIVAALLGGIGIGFVLPIVELARGDGGDPDALLQLFIDAYALLGIPLTLETAVGGVAVVLIARHGVSFLGAYLRVRLRMSFVRHLRLTAAERALDASVGYYDDHGSDEILNAIVTQSGYAGGFITSGAEFLKGACISVVYVAIALYLAPQLTLLAGGTLLVLTVLVRAGFGSGYDPGVQVAEANERVQRTVQRGTQGIRDVKLFGLVPDILSEVTDAVRFHERAVIRLRSRQAAFQQLYRLMSALTVFGLLYAGIAVFAVPLSRLATFLFAMFRLAPQVSAMNDIFYQAEGDLPHVVRSQEFVETLERNAESDADGMPVPGSVDAIALHDVSFSYGDDRVLEDVSFEAERPDFVALVGQSGAGKSTTVSLLTRLYDPDSGTITADGAPIETFDLTAWRDRVSVVRQDPHIFNDTLRFNLLVGNRDASEREMRRVCEVAQVTEFLDGLPDGLDTQLGDDGMKLSGGQRQRVAIARALLKDADVLVLDEATSDLDTRLEGRVHRAIEGMHQNYITIAIAHRLSTVIDADRIHVFDDGRIVETGTHEELVAGEGPYAELYAIQSDGANPSP